MFFDWLQQSLKNCDTRCEKQTFRCTIPSATVGCVPLSQPDEFVLQEYILGHASAVCVPAPPLNRYQPDNLESERLPRLLSVYVIALFDSLRNVYLEHSAKVFQKWFSFKVVCLFFDAVRQCYWSLKRIMLQTRFDLSFFQQWTRQGRI